MISEGWSVAAAHRFISARMRRWRRRIYRIIDCKLVNVSPLPCHLNSPQARRNVPRLHFSKAPDTQSPARHRSLHCSRASSRVRSQFVSAAPSRPAMLLTKSRPREIHPRGALPLQPDKSYCKNAHAGDMARSCNGREYKCVLSANIVAAPTP